MIDSLRWHALALLALVGLVILLPFVVVWVVWDWFYVEVWMLRHPGAREQQLREALARARELDP